MEGTEQQGDGLRSAIWRSVALPASGGPAEEAARLPQVICPRCGAKNDTHTSDYPFCLGCQDNLARCGYCRWYDVGAGLCTHPVVAGIFEVSQTATPPCVYHDPRSRLLDRRGFLQVAVWVGAAAVALLLIGLIGLRLQGPPSPPKQADLGLAIEADYEGAVVGRAFDVTALVTNGSRSPVNGVRLEIARRSLEVFDLLSVKPPAGGPKNIGKWRVISYPTMRPRESRRIVMTLVPKKPGTLHVMVRLVSAGNVFHGLADLPVVVEEEPAGAGP